LKKCVIPPRRSTETRMGGTDDKTPPPSPKKHFGGKGTGEKGDGSGEPHTAVVERVTSYTGEVPKLTKVNYHEWALEM
jgi:hypothetical protein